MRKSCLGHGIAAVAVVCCASMASAAQVYGVSLTTPPSGPGTNFLSITLGLVGTDGTASSQIAAPEPISAAVFIDGPTDVPGALDASHLTSIEFGFNPRFTMTDATLFIGLSVLGNLQATIQNAQLQLLPSGPFAITDGQLDLGGTSATINSGSLVYSASIVGNVATGSLNLTDEPLTFEFPTGSLVNFSLTPLSPTSAYNYLLTATAPISLVSLVATSFNGIFVTLNGNLTLQGVVNVPEANSLLLLGLAGAGVAFAGIRRRLRTVAP